MNQERRQDPRYSVPALVDYTGSELLLCHPIHNLSLWGISICSCCDEEVGSFVDLVLDLDLLNTSIAAQGEVVWTEDQGDLKVLGIRFVELDEDRLKVLKRYLSKMKK